MDYVIEASIGLNRLANQPRQKPLAPDEPQGDDTLSKYYGMFRRRAEKGPMLYPTLFWLPRISRQL